MPVALEFINFIAPIATIKQKYPGGLEQCLRDSCPASWYDEHLFRTGAMNPMDIESMAKKWKKMGFQMTEKKNGRKMWKDFCVVGTFSGPNVECEWLEVDDERFCAYLKGTDPDGPIYGPLYE